MLKLKEEALFRKFTVIWGQKWAKSFEEDRVLRSAYKEWEVVFDRLSDEQILKAIDKCKLLYEFPPSISEFLCAGLEIPSFSSVMYSGQLRNNFFSYVLFYHYISRQEFCEDSYLAKNVYEAAKEDFLLDQNDKINSYKADFIDELQERERKELKEGWKEIFMDLMCKEGDCEHLTEEAAEQLLTEKLEKYGARVIENVLNNMTHDRIIDPIWRFNFLLKEHENRIVFMKPKSSHYSNEKSIFDYPTPIVTV
jgi:hypothetical protein